MWPVIGLLAGAAIISVLEVPAMVRGRMKKDLAAFACLLAAALAISIIYTLRVEVPNPTQLIMRLFMPVSKWIEQLLS
jgi:hypothetical protein